MGGLARSLGGSYSSPGKGEVWTMAQRVASPDEAWLLSARLPRSRAVYCLLRSLVRGVPIEEAGGPI